MLLLLLRGSVGNLTFPILRSKIIIIREKAAPPASPSGLLLLLPLIQAQSMPKIPYLERRNRAQLPY